MIHLQHMGLLDLMMTTVTAIYLIMRSERNPAVFPLYKWEDNSELKMIELQSSNILDSKVVRGKLSMLIPNVGSILG